MGRGLGGGLLILRVSLGELYSEGDSPCKDADDVVMVDWWGCLV